MKRLAILALALALPAFTLASAEPAPPQPAAAVVQADNPAAAKAAAALVGRVLGDRAAEFTVEIIAPENGKNVFEVESAGSKIVLRGDNGVSVASALNHYLKYTAKCQLSWCGDQLNLPNPLPAVPAKIRVVNLHQYRVMFNYCTLNYTCSWWNWDRWERELDFLAMNGINTPLGVIGIEGVWYNTLTKLGFTDLEAREFLVGPTYFAWQWMTNIEGHGGPLPKHWIDERVKVGQKWMTRARELGMTPIQQGFSGNVPRLLKKKQPQAAIAFQPTWCGFPGSAQLDPTDPYFNVIGKTFMEENIKLYGNGHLWAADPFHESAPPKPGAAYLDTVGKTIFALMTEVDPQATWAMQAWSIRMEIACAVPKGKLLVLDLAGGRNDFWGHNFVKGQLHNFGGRINNHGDVRYITGNPFAGAAKNPACKGVGLFPEAIVQNPVFYDAVYDMFWRNGSVDTMQWVTDYATRRYGVDSPKFAEAWKILITQGPYVHESMHAQENSSMIAARPALAAKKSGPNQSFGIPYPPMKLVEVVELLISEADKASGSDGYRYDCADFTRQILTNYAQHLHKEIRLAYLQKDKAAFAAKTAEFHQLLLDVDTLLASRTEFLFGKWLADARSYGATPEEQEYYAWNAAMLVTIWGPEKTPEIFDYSWREWSGLIKEYYLPRWQKFHAMLAESIEKGDYRDPGSQCYGRESLRANAFYSKLADWEIAFSRNAPKNLPSKPVGDSVALAKKLLAKYKPALEKAYSAEGQDALNDGLSTGGTIPANSVKVGSWKPNEITTDGKEIVLDASKAIKEEGAYEVTFTYTGGPQRLEIDWVALTVNGTEVMRDTHVGWAGDPRKDTTYKFEVGGIVFNGKYEIRAKVKTAGGNNSNGVITIKPATATPKGAWDIPSDPAKFHVFLLMGQSNMAGHGGIAQNDPYQPGDKDPVPGILVLDGQGTDASAKPVEPIQWRPGAHRLHFHQESAQFGLGMDFAKAYLKSHPGVTVGLIPCAWGGAEINQLKKGTPIFTNAMERLRFAQKQGVIRGVLWHQGESDSVTPQLADAYEAKLRTLMADVRQETGNPHLPFVIGNLAEFYGVCRDHSARIKLINQVRGILHKVGTEDADAAFVPSTNLKADDQYLVHFNRASYIIFGQRYAEALTTLQKRQEHR